ncbi:MAG: hypothetical protein DRJ40_10890 [Thermoprotei archaeon]|nr:MAG: hypothetical protein DRJ40_10890 [Thermoprotei archaeon]
MDILNLLTTEIKIGEFTVMPVFAALTLAGAVIYALVCYAAGIYYRFLSGIEYVINTGLHLALLFVIDHTVSSCVNYYIDYIRQEFGVSAPISITSLRPFAFARDLMLDAVAKINSLLNSYESQITLSKYSLIFSYLAEGAHNSVSSLEQVISAARAPFLSLASFYGFLYDTKVTTVMILIGASLLLSPALSRLGGFLCFTAIGFHFAAPISAALAYYYFMKYKFPTSINIALLPFTNVNTTIPLAQYSQPVNLYGNLLNFFTNAAFAASSAEVAALFVFSLCSGIAGAIGAVVGNPIARLR